VGEGGCHGLEARATRTNGPAPLSHTPSPNPIRVQHRQHNKTMPLVEHDMMLVMGVADEVVVLDGGKMIASGAP
jgi:ABC-type transporter Mla maintaining outer membrane lipid asymmetry ATPase subunit MlaF